MSTVMYGIRTIEGAVKSQSIDFCPPSPQKSEKVVLGLHVH